MTSIGDVILKSDGIFARYADSLESEWIGAQRDGCIHSHFVANAVIACAMSNVKREVFDLPYDVITICQGKDRLSRRDAETRRAQSERFVRDRVRGILPHPAWSRGFSDAADAPVPPGYFPYGT